MADTKMDTTGTSAEEEEMLKTEEQAHEAAENTAATAEHTVEAEMTAIKAAKTVTTMKQASKEPNARNQNLDYFIEKVENPDTREYIRTRVVDQMDYYRKQSRSYKKQYFRFMTTSIVLGALIPIVSIFSDSTVFMKFLIAALGSAVTAINAYLALNNSRDLWLSYRNSRQSLLQTLYFYFYNTSVFEKAENQGTKDKLLVQCCEKELVNQHNSWRSLVEE